MKEQVKGNKVFSDVNKKKNILDFETEHMKNKIKNVKKKKKMMNIKNIEPLVNIHEMPEEENNNKKPIIEGLNLNPIVSFKDDEWTDPDDIYEGGKKTLYKARSYAEIIEDTYRKIKDKYDNFIYHLTKTFSGDTFNESDVKHVKKYFNWILSIIVASIAVYNWAFITFFRFENGSKVNVWKTPRDFIHHNTFLNPLFWLIDKFTNIPLFFPDFLIIFTTKILPDFITSKIDKNGMSKIVLILIFMAILVSFTFLANNSGELIKNILLDIAKFDFSGILTIIIYFVTLIMFLLTFIESNPLASLLPGGGGLWSLFKVLNPYFWFEKIIISLYLFFLGVPLATCLCLTFIISYTFFSIPIFKGDHSILEIKTLIDKFFDEYKPNERRDTPCQPLSFFEKVINYMVMIFNYMYDNCIQLGFVMVMLYALIDSGINLKSNTLKSTTMVSSVAGIMIVAAYTIISIIKGDKNNETSNPTTNEETSTTTTNPLNAMETIKETLKPEDLQDTVKNISEKLNVDDNKELQDGLKKGVNLLSNLQKIGK
jgi:hypothetical protein